MSWSSYVLSFLPWTQANKEFHINYGLAFAKEIGDRKGHNHYQELEDVVRTCQKDPDHCGHNQMQLRHLASRISPGLDTVGIVREMIRKTTPHEGTWEDYWNRKDERRN